MHKYSFDAEIDNCKEANRFEKSDHSTRKLEAAVMQKAIDVLDTDDFDLLSRSENQHLAGLASTVAVR